MKVGISSAISYITPSPEMSGTLFCDISQKLLITSGNTHENWI